MAAAGDPLSCLPSIESYLDELSRDTGHPAPLEEAIRYALLGGGKRLRPALAWRSCVAVGGRGEESLPAGAAVELIHAFSLVHDDLPCMDNDDVRRGRPTLHRHAGEAMAVLAGDAMMSLAFRSLAERVADGHLAARLTRELADATGRMIAGQVYDTLCPPRGDDLTRLRTIHQNKTGALIRAACVMGAACGPRDPESEKRAAAVSMYGERVGLMFQVVDDLLDVESSAEHTGKRTRKDADAGKTTYPGVLGVDASRREVQRLRDEALEAIGALGPKAEGLRSLCEMMAARTR